MIIDAQVGIIHGKVPFSGWDKSTVSACEVDRRLSELVHEWAWKASVDLTTGINTFSWLIPLIRAVSSIASGIHHVYSIIDDWFQHTNVDSTQIDPISA